MPHEQQSLVSTTRLPVSTAEGLGRANAGLILAAVLSEGSIARAELADLVGLTRATVTRVVSRLIEMGLLLEGSPRRDSPGRPMVPLSLAGENRAVVSVHFGANEFRVGLVDLRGRVLDESRERYGSNDPVKIVERVSQRVLSAQTGYSTNLKILGVGASIGGWVSSDPGEVVRFDPLNWDKVPLVDLLTRSLKLPVHLDQVVRGLALAESMFGAARGLDDFVEMWVGNVVGVAIVQGGLVQSGTTGASGMIAHFPIRDDSGHLCDCGRRNCLEKNINDFSVVSASQIANVVDSKSDVRDVVQLADRGDKFARKLLSEKGAIAGEAAAAVANIIDPVGVVVAGVSTTANAFLESFIATFNARALRSDGMIVRGSAFGDLAPTIASASVLLDAYYRDPLGFERTASRSNRPNLNR
jgi:predicted NBD/HSP70 family sugar kinase